MSPARKQVAVVIGAISKWQAGGRNTGWHTAGPSTTATCLWASAGASAAKIESTVRYLGIEIAEKIDI